VKTLIAGQYLRTAVLQTKRPSPPLFLGLPDSQVSNILNTGHVSEYRARCWLFRQGDPSGHVYLVETGLVRLSELSLGGDDISMRLLKTADVFGYHCLALGGSRVVSAQTLQPSRLWVWDREKFFQLVQEVPTLALNLLDIAICETVYSFDRTRRLLSATVGERVAWAVYELARAVGVSTPAGTLITNGIGQRELAELAGTNIFTVSRELTKLQRLGILEKQRGRIAVSKPENLLVVINNGS
jgi:CRP/FNR family transcriptional regulator, nitrogen oxide reductase regulator